MMLRTYVLSFLHFKSVEFWICRPLGLMQWLLRKVARHCFAYLKYLVKWYSSEALGKAFLLGFLCGSYRAWDGYAATITPSVITMNVTRAT